MDGDSLGLYDLRSWDPTFGDLKKVLPDGHYLIEPLYRLILVAHWDRGHYVWGFPMGYMYV